MAHEGLIGIKVYLRSVDIVRKHRVLNGVNLDSDLELAKNAASCILGPRYLFRAGDVEDAGNPLLPRRGGLPDDFLVDG